MKRVEQALVLVGGKGTRLGSLTLDTPKPLLIVDGRPFLDFVLQWLSTCGISRVLLLAGHKSQQVVDQYDGRS